MFIVEVAGPCGGWKGPASEHPNRTRIQTRCVSTVQPPCPGQQARTKSTCCFSHWVTLTLPVVHRFADLLPPPPVFALLQRAPWSIPSFIYCPCKSKQSQVDRKLIVRKPSYLGIIHSPPLHKTSSALMGAAAIQYGFLVMISSNRCYHTSAAVKM